MSADAQSVAIRAMSAADVSRVIEIAEALKEAPHWPRAAYESALHAGAVPRRIALVAEQDGAVKGFAVVSLPAGEAELESIAVERGSQRHGVGRRLFAEILEMLKREGIPNVMLEVRASNERAVEFYRVLGFEESGRRRAYYADPVEDALLLSLRVG